MGSEWLRLCGIGFLCAVCAMILKGIRGEFAVAVRIAGTVLLGGVIALFAKETLTQAAELLSYASFGRYAELLLKALGVAILCSTCGDVCRDCGENTIAGGVECAGNLVILSLCVPVVGELIGYADALMGMG